MPDWTKHKPESRLLGEISITSDVQVTRPLRQKAKKDQRASAWKVKEESEKVGLQLNIQKTKITASSPITSWQIVCLGTSIPGRWELAVSLGPCSPLHLDLGRGVLISASLSQLPWPLMEAYVGQKCGSGPAPVKRPRGSVLWGGGGGLGGSGLQHPKCIRKPQQCVRAPYSVPRQCVPGRFGIQSLCPWTQWHPKWG